LPLTPGRVPKRKDGRCQRQSRSQRITDQRKCPSRRHQPRAQSGEHGDRTHQPRSRVRSTSVVRSPNNGDECRSLGLLCHDQFRICRISSRVTPELRSANHEFTVVSSGRFTDYSLLLALHPIPLQKCSPMCVECYTTTTLSSHTHLLLLIFAVRPPKRALPPRAACPNLTLSLERIKTILRVAFPSTRWGSYGSFSP